jgi:hypothetical protein
MGWEERNGRMYYYAKRWRNGTCRSEYIGSGQFASAVEDMEFAAQCQAKYEKDKKDAERRELEMIDAMIEEISETNNTLVKALFLINGYHTHKYQWRRKR